MGIADHPPARAARRAGLTAAVAALALVLWACGGTEETESAGPAEATQNAATEPGTDGDEGASPEPGDGDEDASADAGAEPGDGSAEAAEGPVAPETAPTEEAVDAAAASFSSIVMPILENWSASCHGAGGPGAVHMELTTAADATTYADDIALQTVARVMPPWPASHLSLEFQDNYSLTDDEIEVVTSWAEAGGPIDVEPTTPIEPTRQLARIEDPDLVVTSAGGPYTGSPMRPDDYRCLIFDPEVTEPEWMLASHFEPDQVVNVHHGIFSLASGELREQAERWDALEQGPGWTCYGGTGLSTADGGYEFGIGGWAPGANPSVQPDGYAIPLRPGDFFVIQIHYHYEELPEQGDLSRMVFDLASDEEITAQPGGTYKTQTGMLYLGPAEIPCYADDTDPLCDRDAAIERLRDLYGNFGASLPDGMLNQCGSTPEDYADMTDGRASSTCDLPVRNPGRVTSVTGHMHELGESIRLTLNPDTPEEQILLDIPNWQFEWQLHYRPVDELILDEDDVIRIDCSWDRARNPFDARGYILWSEGTGDEMCYSSITTAPLED